MIKKPGVSQIELSWTLNPWKSVCGRTVPVMMQQVASVPGESLIRDIKPVLFSDRVAFFSNREPGDELVSERSAD